MLNHWMLSDILARLQHEEYLREAEAARLIARAELASGDRGLKLFRLWAPRRSDMISLDNSSGPAGQNEGR